MINDADLEANHMISIVTTSAIQMIQYRGTEQDLHQSRCSPPAVAGDAHAIHDAETRRFR